MTVLASFDTSNENSAAITKAATTRDPDVVYLVHHYGRDDWHGAGTPYATLAAALTAAGDHYDGYDGAWVDAAEIFASSWYKKAHGSFDMKQAPGTLWYPVEYEGDMVAVRDIGDDHPYVERAVIRK